MRRSLTVLLLGLLVGPLAAMPGEAQVQQRARPECAEPNDTIARSCPIVHGEVDGRISSALDVDLYRIIIPSGSLRVRADLVSLPADFDLSLTDLNGQQLGGSANVATQEELIERTLPRGTYFLAVMAGRTRSFDPERSYRLPFTFIDRPPPLDHSVFGNWPNRQGCRFTLGFQTFRALMDVGLCLDHERFNAVTGDTFQFTSIEGSIGQLVWHHASNITSFTDGGTIWLLGPEGLVYRDVRGQPFPWEEVGQRSRAAVPRGPTRFDLDMGDPGSEVPFRTRGWAHLDYAGWKPFDSPSGDRTKRYQTLRGDNDVFFSPVDVLYSYRLVAEVEDGACTDDFQILANDVLIYTFIGWQPSVLDVIDPKIREHSMAIPASVVQATELKITFRNISYYDNCGLAGVYNTRLERLP